MAAGQAATSSLTFSYDPLYISTISFFGSRSTSGGTTVLITGGDFGDDTTFTNPNQAPQVFVGSKLCNTLTVLDVNTLQCQTPLGGGANLPIAVCLQQALLWSLVVLYRQVMITELGHFHIQHYLVI